MKSDENIAEQILVLRCQAGDERAFYWLVQRHHARLLYFMRRLLPDGDSAEDAVQDVWLRVFRRLRRLRKPEAFRAWLYRIARNRAYEQLRKKHPFESLPEDLPAPESPRTEQALRPEDAARVHAALQRVRPEHREVLVLYFLEQMPYREIAEVVGCNLGTVKSRMHYAKLALRREMEALTDGK